MWRIYTRAAPVSRDYIIGPYTAQSSDLLSSLLTIIYRVRYNSICCSFVICAISISQLLLLYIYIYFHTGRLSYTLTVQVLYLVNGQVRYIYKIICSCSDSKSEKYYTTSCIQEVLYYINRTSSKIFHRTSFYGNFVYLLSRFTYWQQS